MSLLMCLLGHCIVMPYGMGSVSVVCIWQDDLDRATDVHKVRYNANKWRFRYPSLSTSL